jgi:acetyl-CoA carboxylase biotin carboxylase subunit
VHLVGHAIECRINAETPELGFQPCPGRIEQWVGPQGTGIRVDSHCYSGYFISPYYDSLMAKVITSGVDRFQAMERMRSALERFVVTGIDTTIPFLRGIFNQPDYIKGQIHTRWIEEFLDSLPSPGGEEEEPPSKGVK